jgi:PleD family two-component response regulator
VSRTHARVTCDAEGRTTVTDLGSANGTFVNGRRITAPVRVLPGDVLQAGPLRLRLERVSSDKLDHLDRIIAFQGDADRDRLSGLLDAPYVLAGLPKLLAETPEPVSAVLIDVDRISALHASYGQEVADVVFQNVARLVAWHVPYPELCVRLNYGRLMAMLPHARIHNAFEIAAPLSGVIESHEWSTLVHRDQELRVTVTGAVAERLPGETAEALVMRLGIVLNQGRLEGGRNRIYR